MDEGCDCWDCVHALSMYLAWCNTCHAYRWHDPECLVCEVMKDAQGLYLV